MLSADISGVATGLSDGAGLSEITGEGSKLGMGVSLGSGKSEVVGEGVGFSLGEAVGELPTSDVPGTSDVKTF